MSRIEWLGVVYIICSIITLVTGAYLYFKDRHAPEDKQGGYDE